MRLFVDDIRQCPVGWDVARTITVAIRLLDTQSVEEISLDHDICHIDKEAQENRHIERVVSCPEDYTPVARFVANLPEKNRPKKIRIHTANPNGYERLRAILLPCYDTVLYGIWSGDDWIDRIT